MASFALPSACNGTVPNVSEPSLNTTMPVGVPPDAATEAVKVIGCSSVAGVAEEAMLVVVTDSGFCALALPVRSTATQMAKKKEVDAGPRRRIIGLRFIRHPQHNENANQTSLSRHFVVLLRGIAKANVALTPMTCFRKMGNFVTDARFRNCTWGLDHRGDLEGRSLRARTGP